MNSLWVPALRLRSALSPPAAGIVVLFTLFLSGSGCAKRESKPLEQDFYVWRPSWSAETGALVLRASEKAAGFQVFAGEATRDRDGAVSMQPCAVDWKVLAAARRPVVTVFRMNAGFVPLLADSTAMRKWAPDFARFARGTLESARAANLQVNEVQLDYDCPTARLDGYIRLVNEIKALLPATALSITVLPTWMESSHFHELISSADSFVFQAHSVEPPRSAERARDICDVERLKAWLPRLKGVKKPFLVALPTYGCQVVFDASGKFRGMSGASDVRAREPGWRVVTVVSDPDQMSEAVRYLRENRPALCRGVVWFRLPTEDDPLSWTWETLCAVMEGRPPSVRISAAGSHPKPDDLDLCEVQVWSDGEHVPFGARVRLRPDWRGREVLAADGWNGFQLDSDGLTGPAPRTKEPVAAGWFRLKSDPKSAKMGAVNVTVEVLP